MHLTSFTLKKNKKHKTKSSWSNEGEWYFQNMNKVELPMNQNVKSSFHFVFN